MFGAERASEAGYHFFWSGSARCPHDLDQHPYGRTQYQQEISTTHLLPFCRTLVHALLERQELFRAERLIVDLGSRLDQILQVSPIKKMRCYFELK